MMLLHFYHHHHLLLRCHVTSRIYTSLCRRKSNLDQSQHEGGVSVAPHLTAAVSASHDVIRCSALLRQKRAKMLWKQDCSISESEPTKTSHLLQALVQRFNTIQLYLQGSHTCMRDPLFFPLSPLVHFPLLFIIRASSQFLAVNLASCADHWGRILFSAGERHRRGTSEDVSPHHLLLISVTAWAKSSHWISMRLSFCV